MAHIHFPREERSLDDSIVSLSDGALAIDPDTGTLQMRLGGVWVGSAAAAARAAGAAKYLLTSDGVNVRATDATGTVLATGTDVGAALSACLPAAGSAGVHIEFRNDGNIFPNRSLVSFRKGATGKVLVRGNGAVVQAAESAGRRLFDFSRTADYDTFQNIEVWDLTFDRNNIVNPGTNETVFMGNLVGGGWSRRINFDHIRLIRCKTINVPTGGVGSNISFGLAGAQLASSESTQNTITNIFQEDCEWGGDTGFAILGINAPGGSVTAGLGLNVFYDEIHVIRGTCDPGTTPTGFFPAGPQIGGYAYGRKVRITDWTSKNAGDVGIEVDGCQDLVGRGNRIVDAWNTKYLVGNFRPPLDVRSQRAVWRDCFCGSVALDRGTRMSRDFEIFGSPSNASAVDFGSLDVENFESTDTISAMPFVGVPHLLAQSVTFRSIKFKGRIGYSALNVTAGGGTFTGIQVRNTVSASAIDLDVTYTLAGTRSGAGNVQWKMTDLNGNDATVRARVAHDVAGYTGLSTASDTFYWIGIGLIGASTMRLESLTPVCLATLGAAQGTHHGIFLSSNWTLAGTRAYVEKMDMAKSVATAGFDVDIVAAGAKSQVLIRNTVSQRTAASGSGPITAPTALTGLVTATGVTVGSVSAGVPCIVQFVQGTGAGITAIDFSTNGGTNYVNLLTQAAGALPAGADINVGPLPPDALIKVTFATTQPTINLVPANP